MNRKLLIAFYKWYLKKYKGAIQPQEIVEEIVDNFLTFDSYHQIRQN